MIVDLVRKLTRRQVVKKDRRITLVNDSQNGQVTDNNLVLDRNLNLPTLIFLNVSNSIGSGIYVLTGMASYLYAGQYVSLSYLLAGFACLLSAFCFAEFASRVKSSSGSSYTFIYYSLGEFVAFIIGWMLFIGSLTAIAATAITWSSYLDTATDYAIKNFTINKLHASWDLSTPFNSYLDIPAVLITVLFFLISLRGINLTTLFNNTIAILNISLLVIITIGGFVYGNLDNLTKVNYQHGFNGVIRGASIVMYAFIGFESSTCAIDEAINPTRNVPLSMIISLVIISLTYCGSSLSLNMMQPFDQIDMHASFPTAFARIKFMHIIVTIGPIISLMGSLIASIYSIARIAYTMSKDGLLFKYLSSINQSTKIPHKATYTSCVICVFLVIIIDVKSLIGFSDITGFLTYSMIALGLLVVRYNLEITDQPYGMANPINEIMESSLDIYENLEIEQREDITFLSEQNEEQETNILIAENGTSPKKRLKILEPIYYIIKSVKKKKFFRSKMNSLVLIMFIYLSNIAYFGLLHHMPYIKSILIVLIAVSNLICTLVLSLFRQTKIPKDLTFKMPFVPFLPVVVIILNVYLMMASEAIEWIIFGVLIVTSLPIYFLYGIRHSKLSNMNEL